MYLHNPQAWVANCNNLTNDNDFQISPVPSQSHLLVFEWG